MTKHQAEIAVTRHGIADSASWLFVPGHRPEQFAKGIAAAPQMLVLDLEDGVPVSEKAQARQAITEWLTHGGVGCVRVNAASSPEFSRDLEVLRRLSGLRCVILSKSEDVAAIDEAAEEIDRPVIPLIETALGVANVRSLAAAAGAARLALGAVDLTLDLGIANDDENLAHARYELVLASRVAGLAAPLDSVPMNFGDPDAIYTMSHLSRQRGFGGRMCIHPSQVSPINRAYLPDEAELKWARGVIENASEDGPSQMEGSMIDLPVLERARRILAARGV
ncbi:CoA ester lyase [Rhodococcus erythropolis]|nr:CoA ester lyase [Rhodococcus erythropolis]